MSKCVDTAKESLRKKSTALNAYFKKQITRINDLSFYLKKLKKEKILKLEKIKKQKNRDQGIHIYINEIEYSINQ